MGEHLIYLSADFGPLPAPKLDEVGIRTFDLSSVRFLRRNSIPN